MSLAVSLIKRHRACSGDGGPSICLERTISYDEATKSLCARYQTFCFSFIQSLLQAHHGDIEKCENILSSICITPARSDKKKRCFEEEIKQDEGEDSKKKLKRSQEIEKLFRTIQTKEQAIIAVDNYVKESERRVGNSLRSAIMQQSQIIETYRNQILEYQERLSHYKATEERLLGENKKLRDVNIRLGAYLKAGNPSEPRPDWYAR